MGAFKYFFMLMAIVLAMYAGTQLLELKSEQDATTSQIEIPANMLMYAKEDVKKSYYSTAFEHVENAIRTMRQAERVLDDESQDYIEVAIDELHKIERELNSGYLFEEDLNLIFANSLNSLAYAYMRVTEKALEEENQEKARNALSVAVKQLDYSTRFASGQLFESENAIMKSLAEMLNNDGLKMEEVHPYTEGLKLLVVNHNNTAEAQ
jgi:hypothetical protein